MPVAVHRFDTLAPKTVFMPGGLPTAGFHGFAQSGGSLLPGVKLEDYISQETEELFVPTMALAQDLTQFSVRMALMDNRTETGTHFSVCSAEGATGWSPFLPNKFASSVLEPLRAQQQAKWTFASFWSKYLPQVQMPERVMAAHGAVFSLSRDSIRSHPKSYYERLLAELEGSKDPYQAFYLEHMWWYIFHPTAKAPCGADVVAPETRVAASRSLGDKRRLAEIITVLDPRAGDVIEFGSTQQLSWTSTHNGYFRVELWRYGSFSTRMYDSKFLYAGSTATVNWNVYPGPSADDAPDVYPDSTTSCVDQTGYLDAYGYSCADWTLPVGDYWGPNGYGVADGESDCGLANLQYAIDPYVGGYTADQMAQIRAACPLACGVCGAKTKTYTATMMSSTTWFHHYQGLVPGDKYTIRVCGFSSDPEEQICDSTFGESGEFDIVGVIDMLSPVRENMFAPGTYVPITWQSYWMGATVDLKITKDGAPVYSSSATADDGVFTFYVSPDMAAGVYEVTVAKAGEACAGGSCKTFFTVLGAPAPPPASASPPPPPPTPGAPGSHDWEVPIIQAFKGSFGLDEIQDATPGFDDHGITSTVAGGINCDYVCHVYTTSNGVVGGRRSRRLLFGGLQYSGVDTNAVVGCSEDMIKCGCCASRR